MTFHSEAFQIFAYIAFTLFVLASMGKPASALTPQPTSTPVDDEFGEDLTNEFNANFLDICPEPIWETEPKVTQPTNYHQMNSKELRELAKVHQVKGWWNMKKSQIIAELEKLA